MSTPDFRLPAEWEPQAGVMLTWPHADTDWADVLQQVLPVFAEIGAHISAHERLLSVCRSRAQAYAARHEMLNRGARRDRLCFVIAHSNDTWARDHGPLTTLHADQPILNDYIFNVSNTSTFMNELLLKNQRSCRYYLMMIKILNYSDFIYSRIHKSKLMSKLLIGYISNFC